MFTRMTALAALACFALSGAAMAQETATQEETPNTVPTSEGDLSLGEDTSVPQVGQTYVREVVQDWEIQCVKTQTGEDEPCQMYQLLQNEAGNPVAEVSLFKLPQGGQAVAGATTHCRRWCAEQALPLLAVQPDRLFRADRTDEQRPQRFQARRESSCNDCAICCARSADPIGNVAQRLYGKL
jgi:hypothetical protein